jgi:hypothetical protein
MTKITPLQFERLHVEQSQLYPSKILIPDGYSVDQLSSLYMISTLVAYDEPVKRLTT